MEIYLVMLLDKLIMIIMEYQVLEKTFDYELTTSKEPLKFTLDTDLQYLIREELLKSKDIFQNIGSAAILMDINNGDILSMISLPDFDLNKREKIND